PNATEYRSPSATTTATQPSVPGFGGMTETLLDVPLSFAFTTNVPFAERVNRTRRTGPFWPFASRYLKPVAAVPDQNRLPELLVPCGKGNDCALGVPPFAMTSRLPPSTVGSPTRVFGLPASWPVHVTLRGALPPGFTIASFRPRTVCSAAIAATPPADQTITAMAMAIRAWRRNAPRACIARLDHGSSPDCQQNRRNAA